jgi:hypothetical protein
MNHRIDSVQIVAAIGSAAGYIAANYDRIAATACALAGLGYTLWRWRAAAKKAEREAAQ